MLAIGCEEEPDGKGGGPRDSSDSFQGVVLACPGNSAFLPYFYRAEPVYYRDTFIIQSEWGSGPFETWIGYKADGVRAETRSLEMIYPDGVAYWRVIDGGFRPDSRIEFSYMRCVDPISGGRPVESSIAVVTSHLGTPVPAAWVHGTTWGFDFANFAYKYSSSPNEQRFSDSPNPMFPEHNILVRFDVPSDDLPLRATMGWARRDDGSQDLCLQTRSSVLTRPWSAEAYFDPEFGALDLSPSNYPPATQLHVAHRLSILGTFEPDGSAIAFPKWRYLRPWKDSGLNTLFECDHDPSYCEPCPDGSGALCMQHMAAAIDVWRSPIPLVDRTAEEIALDPGCP